MEEFQLCLMLFITFVIIASILYFLKTLKIHANNLPPGPKPLPIIGNLFALTDKPHLALAQLAKVYGPVMSLKLGQVTTIIISSPELAREILQKKDQAFCSRYIPDAARAVNHHYTSIAWLPAGQYWKNMRILCSTHLFTSQKLDSNKDLRRKKVQELVTYLHERGAADEPVDIGRAAFMTTINLMSNTLFSIDMVDSYSNSAQIFRDLMWGIMEETGGANISDCFPILRGLDLQWRRRKTDGYLRRLHQIYDKLIDERLENMKVGCANGKDFLDTLIRCHVDDGVKNINRDTMKSLLDDLFVGGTETSSITVEWAMAELLHDTDKMSKARLEIKEALASKEELDESDILQLPYLHAIVKETLRLHPPAPFLLPRKTETNTELHGYTIPENTRVLVNAWAIGRDKSAWENAEIFMPERFLHSDVEYEGRDFELIPFGAGRRKCPGLPLAFRMVHLMLASMLHKFEWKLSDGMKGEDLNLSDKFGTSLALANPIHAIPVPDGI